MIDAPSAATIALTYERLSPDERLLVDVLAVAGTPLAPDCIDRALEHLGGQKPERVVAGPVKHSGLAAGAANPEWLGHDPAFRPDALVVPKAVAEIVARILVEEGRFGAIARAVDAAEPLPRAYYGTTYRIPSQRLLYRHLRMAFYERNWERITEIYGSLRATCAGWLGYLDDMWWPTPEILYAHICAKPFDRDWLFTLPDHVMDATVPVMADEPLGLWTEAPDGLRRLLEDGCAGRLGREVPVRWHFVLAYWRFLEADFEGCARGLPAFTGSGIEGGVALARFGLDVAVDTFNGALAEIRDRSDNRNALFRGAIGALHLIALWLRNTPADIRKAKALAAAWRKARPVGLLNESLALVPDLLVHDEAARDRFATTFDELAQSVWRSDPLGFTLAYLLAAWLDRETAITHAETAEACADLAARAGMVWPARELRVVLDRLRPGASPTESGPAAPADGATLVASRLPLMEGWERALQALAAVGAAAPEVAGAPQDRREARLVWAVADAPYASPSLPYSLEPCEQKRSARGWGKGKRLSLDKLAKLSAASDAMLLEQDHRAVRHVVTDRNRPGRILDPRVWLALAGHPNLVRAGSFEPVDLAAGQFELEVKKLKGEFARIDLEPAFEDGDEVVVWAETPTRLKVAEVTTAHRQIRKILGSEGLTVPLSAREKVLDALGAVSSVVAVVSDIGGASLSSERVTADSRPVLRLMPDGAGLEAAVLVRPFGDVGPCHAPGKGGKALFAEVDGRRLQIERDLVAEREGAEALLGACPALRDAEPCGELTWALPDPLQCLELLEQIDAIPFGVRALWPAGQPFRLAGRADFGQLRLRVAQSRDWFGIAGEVQVNEELVIDMQRLLDLLGGSRFVALDDGRFLALTEAFRKRLADLAALTETHGKTRRVHVLAASLLEELTAGAGDFASDELWREQIDRLREAEALQMAVPAGLEADLRDYQVAGFQWLARLARWGAGACLADDMGLGKTVQALATILARAGGGPTLVVAPTSVCANWQSEARRFAPALRAAVLGPGDREAVVAALGPMDLLICSYALLQQDSVAEILAGRDWQTVVLDEAQAIKNAGTRRSQAAMQLRGAFKVVTTGTPVENHLGELWNLFRFINPGLLGSLEAFNRRFAIPIDNGDGEARARLKRLIAPFILRRLKSQVLDELPPRTDIQLDVELSEPERAFYEALRRKVVAELAELEGRQLAAGPRGAGEKQVKVLAAITKLRRACCHPSLVQPDLALPGSKLAALEELLAELLDNRHKALVFSQFVDHLAKIREFLDGRGISHQYLDGQTPADERKARVDAFQAGAGDLFLISLKAGGLGINLTAADYVIHMDPWWNPAVEDQASDRAHRLGQQRPVTVYRLVAKDTIEEKIVSLHRHKRDLADSVLAGADAPGKIDTDELLRLIREG